MTGYTKKVALFSIPVGLCLFLIHLSVSGHGVFVQYSIASYAATFIFALLCTGVVAFVVFRTRQKSIQDLGHRETQLREMNQKLLEEIEERKKTEEQLGHSQKMEAIGRLAGGVAHDVNNVLASIMTVASAVKMDVREDGKVDADIEDLEDILEACKRGRDLTLSLLGFARKGVLSHRPMSINQAVTDVQNLLERVAPKTIDLQVQMQNSSIQVEGDPSQIKNVLMNLCINGIDAMPDGGVLTLSVVSETLSAFWHGLEPGRYVKITVEDTGEGMSQEVVKRAFDPFFTTKPEGKGTGLGLSRAWGTIKEHGGTVVIDSESGKGTSIRLCLPELGVVDEDPGIRASLPPVSAKTLTGILLVDDESMIRKSGKRLLEKLGYRVYLAGDGAEAIDVYRAHRNDISIVLLDMMMPVMDGATAFGELRKLEPFLPVILCSGYSEDRTVKKLLENKYVGFVQKPFSPGDLSDQMDTMIRKSRAHNG